MRRELLRVLRGLAAFWLGAGITTAAVMAGNGHAVMAGCVVMLGGFADMFWTLQHA